MTPASGRRPALSKESPMFDAKTYAKRRDPLGKTSGPASILFLEKRGKPDELRR
ncbi:MAG: hypothetical protein MZV70_69220 [Desulfobacterales bacterium]|nr:hypothetical protein [Desulfobacterales bacterium]